MANGTISLPSTDSRLEGRIIWESSNNGPVANSSTVVATMQILRMMDIPLLVIGITN